MDPAGILMFEFIDDPQLLEVHVFTTTKYRGTLTESDGNSERKVPLFSNLNIKSVIDRDGATGRNNNHFERPTVLNAP